MAITPATYNIKNLQRRADYPLQVQFKDGNNVGINITGWTVVAQVWDKARVTKYGDFTVTVEDALVGKVKLMLPYTVTVNLPDECRYDVMLINTAGLREYYLEGIIRPSQGYSAPV